ncbi:type II secretion system F family protein [Jonesiaceae bacterium BS-20]|uniref:Type II secretion system F family protein n=1 Tax=Jonesiaceae bacterium BS-20 TaxID=3120821 RepID=A0AAU7DXW6_9MICO
MMSPLLGILLGLAFATGTLLIVRQLRARTITLEQRLTPYLVVADQRARVLGENRAQTPLDVLGRIIAPWFTSLSSVLAKLGSTQAQVQRKLALAGRDTEVDRFRLEQIGWACSGLLVGLMIAVTLAMTRQSNGLLLGVVVGICALLGVFGSEYRLTVQIKTRTARLMMEFPTIAELLALAVSAGQSPLAALDRVARTAHGQLAGELAITLGQVRAGTPMQTALLDLGQRTEVPTIIRFADAIATAIERGTPLAAVLQAQAQDARDAGHRELMQIGGTKELQMLFPVVFLILPITVVFAAFPSVIAFNIGF